MKRKTFLAGAAGALRVAVVSACGNQNQTAEISGSGFAGGALTITDVAGRTVALESASTKIILGESRQAYSLLFLQRDNLMDKVVAWGTDIQSTAPDIYDRLMKAQPKAAELPIVGSVAKGGLSMENLLECDPDLFLMTLEQYEAAKQARFNAKLDFAKIPYLVTDFRKKPMENTHISVRLLGQALGVSGKADEFLTYYDSLVNPVLGAAKTKVEADRPSAFIWRSPGISEPGRTFGESSFGQIITASGDNNPGTKLVDGDAGTVTAEQLIASQPDIIIATGGDWEKQKVSEKTVIKYVKLGYNAIPEETNQTLEQLSSETGYSGLKAFSDKQVYGIYYQLYDAPYNFPAYVAFAEWRGLEVDGLPEVDAAWSEFHDKFIPFKAEGVFAARLS